MKKVGLFLVSLFALIFTACNFDLDEIIRESELEYITVDISGAEQITFLLGEGFNSKGIKVIGHYTDDTSREEDIRLVEFSGFTSEAPNAALPITVAFKDFTSSYNVEIREATVVSISVLQKPYKSVYNLYDTEIDTAGLMVIAEYSNGETVALEKDKDFILGPFSVGKMGTQQISVIYVNDQSIATSFEVYVYNYNIKQIVITGIPRQIYMVGESIDLTGLVVMAYYDVDTMLPTPIGDGIYQISVEDKKIEEKPEGEYEIKVYVSEDIFTSFNITIINSYVNGLELGGDYHSLFYEGNTLNLSFEQNDYRFYKKLSNGTSVSITSNETNEKKANSETANTNYSYIKYSYNTKYTEEQFENARELSTPITFTGTGLQTIYFYYKYYSMVTSKIEFQTIEKQISVADSPLKYLRPEWTPGTGYPLGVSPDDSNRNYGTWTIYGVLENGNEINIPSEYCTYKYRYDNATINANILVSDAEKYTMTPVKITYFDVRKNKEYEPNDEVKVKVISPNVEKVEIVKLPKTNYKESEQLDLTGLVVKITYTDGSSTEKNYNELSSSGSFSSDMQNGATILNNTSSVKLTFYGAGSEQYYVDMPISVTSSSVVGVCIKSKDSEPLSFRDAKNYTTTEFFKYFNVYFQYDNNSLSTGPIGDTEKQNCTFKLKKQDIYTFLDVVYTYNNKSYSNTYEGQDSPEFSGINERITLLHALPKRIDITPPLNLSNITSLDNIITNSGTQYKITYENGDEKTISGSDISNNEYMDSVGKYNFSNVSNQFVKIDFVANEVANEETAQDINLSFSNTIIKGIIIKPKQNKNINFVYGESYNYNDYFDTYIVSSDNNEYQIDNSKITYQYSCSDISKIHSDVVKGNVVALYKSNDRTYTASYEVDIYPPLVSSVSIYSIDTENVNDLTKQGNYKNYITYKVCYKDGFEELKKENDFNGCKLETENTPSWKGSLFSQIKLKVSVSDKIQSGNKNSSVNDVIYYIQFDKLEVNNILNKDLDLLMTSNGDYKNIFDIKRCYTLKKVGTSENIKTLYLNEDFNTYNITLKRNNPSNIFEKALGYVEIKDSNSDNIITYGNNPNDKNVYIYPNVTKINCNKNKLLQKDRTYYYWDGNTVTDVQNYLLNNYEIEITAEDNRTITKKSNELNEDLFYCEFSLNSDHCYKLNCSTKDITYLNSTKEISKDYVYFYIYENKIDNWQYKEASPGVLNSLTKDVLTDCKDIIINYEHCNFEDNKTQRDFYIPVPNFIEIESYNAPTDNEQGQITLKVRKYIIDKSFTGIDYIKSKKYQYDKSGLSYYDRVIEYFKDRTN